MSCYLCEPDDPPADPTAREQWDEACKGCDAAFFADPPAFLVIADDGDVAMVERPDPPGGCRHVWHRSVAAGGGLTTMIRRCLKCRRGEYLDRNVWRREL